MSEKDAIIEKLKQAVQSYDTDAAMMAAHEALNAKIDIVEAIEKGHVRAATSTLSLLEILVQPYREKLDDLVLKFYALLTTFPNIRWIELSKEIADSAARIRAEYRLKTPDAIQVATALSSGATGFVCNDPVFKRVREFECLLLEDCLQRRGR